MRRLNKQFFNRNTVIVAKELLGKYLCRRVNPSAGSGQVARVIRAKITETEAYCGLKDKASHASRGLTPRTKLMFGPPGHSYVYMIYGMYYCLNIVTEREGYPAAVLVRTAEILNPKFQGEGSHRGTSVGIASEILNKSKISSSEIQRLKGPGILCRELRVDKKLNGVDLVKSKELWIEDSDEKPSLLKIKKGKRIGVDYAGKWKNKLWRFCLDRGLLYGIFLLISTLTLRVLL